MAVRATSPQRRKQRCTGPVTLPAWKMSRDPLTQCGVSRYTPGSPLTVRINDGTQRDRQPHAEHGMKRITAHPSYIGLLSVASAIVLLTGCENGGPRADLNDAQIAAYLEYTLPKTIEIQRFLTKPVSHVGDGEADGLEVILGAYDATGDLTKVVGTFHFELETRRMSDRIGSRVAFWPVEVHTPAAMQMYRDHLSRFYHFPLELDQKPLPPGQYLLRAWLILPTKPENKRLYSEYEFTYDGSDVPTLRRS